MKTRKNKLRTIAIMAAVTLLGAMANVHKIHAATIPVTSTADDGSAGTLRAVLASAVNGDTIDATGVSGTIVLTNGELMVSNSITIVGPGPANLTVNGNQGPHFVVLIRPSLVVTISSLTISNGLFGGISNNRSSLTVSNCTVSGNGSGSPGGGIRNVGSGSGSSASLVIISSTIIGNACVSVGAGIYNEGVGGSATLEIHNSIVSGNSAGQSGGGIYSDGRDGIATVTVSQSTVSGNSSGKNGGGIYNDGSSSGNASVTVTSSILSENSAELSGGAIYNTATNSGNATLTIANSILSGNSASQGGAICNDGSSALGSPPGSATAAISASTFNGNSATFGSAIRNDGINGSAILTLANSTLSGNSAVGGGAIENLGFSGSGRVVIGNCTLSGNAGGGINNSHAHVDIGNTILHLNVGGNIQNGVGSVNSHGFNLSSDDGASFLTNSTDQINANPLLGPLQDNGGATFTHALLPGSMAIDKGNRNAIPELGSSTDQRGFPRPVDLLAIPNAAGGDGSDIGAFETEILSADLLVSVGVDKTSVKQGEQLTYTITVHNFGPQAAANVVINDTLSSGSTFVSAQANRGNFTKPPVGQTGTVTWNLGDLSNGDGEGAQLLVKVIVKGKTTITNTATASTNSSDPNAANNSASITVSVVPGTTGGKK